MFKKPKSNKNITPPSAPTLDEILADIDTFQVDVEQLSSKNKTPDIAINNTEEWWSVFEQFIEDLKCLEMVHSEVEGFKIKLESLKLEIDTESKLLKNEIDQQQQLIDVALE
ncbi:hypothetical protein FF38_11685 [Lucilia cuprina]|uniref:Uncharacterized protein n=1 Tax=Lucilia cuprina TaxID=7375 RepID=A0A0L0CEJ1_LUCCU|nr:uncharacterized protein LOC111690588 [Lucilia cuprina]KAI8123262.1 hypothetical protein CVS40_6238 [Lucilia cuprina]KNC30676.1 hypothetical protein FF38_11685 [Lucilia cuprina]